MKTKYFFCLVFSCLLYTMYAQSWHHLGPGIGGPVYEIVAHGDDVYVGGHFQNAGGDPDADFLARWDGCEWHAVAAGLNKSVFEIAIVGDRVYVSGNFTDVAGNDHIDGIAFWDGTEWNGLGSGLDYYVADMEVIGNDLYVAGGFNQAGGKDICLIARWDGSEWHGLGSGPSFCAYDFSFVSDIATDGTDLYAVGLFYDMGGIEHADRVARWDGKQWHSLGDGINSAPLWSDDLTLLVENNNVFVAGTFTNAGGNDDADYLVVWDGNQWNGLSESLSDSTAHIPFLFQGVLYCVFGNEIRKWNTISAEWDSFIAIDELYTLTADADNIYVGGFFNQIDSQPLYRIARWGEEIECTSATTWENAEQLVFNVYPNPADDIIYYDGDVNPDEIQDITITTANGNEVAILEMNENGVDISSLGGGMYFIEMQTESGRKVGKFIKP